MFKRSYVIPLAAVLFAGCESDSPTVVSTVEQRREAVFSAEELAAFHVILMDASERVLRSFSPSPAVEAITAALAEVSRSFESSTRAESTAQLTRALDALDNLTAADRGSAARADIDALELHLARIQTLIAHHDSPTPLTNTIPQEHE